MTTYSDSARLRVLSMVDAATARHEAAEIDLPHVVYVYDRVLGIPCALGPFRSSTAACPYADRFVREVLTPYDDMSSLRIDVVALQLADTVAGSRWYTRWWPRPRRSRYDGSRERFGRWRGPTSGCS